MLQCSLIICLKNIVPQLEADKLCIPVFDFCLIGLKLFFQGAQDIHKLNGYNQNRVNALTELTHPFANILSVDLCSQSTQLCVCAQH
jgi:hypothetical protein